MIRAAPKPKGLLRHVFVTLAVLALAVKILIPQGFMTSANAGGLPFDLVLCTGHGPMTVAAPDGLNGHGDHEKSPSKTSHEAPCAFAGHGGGAPPPTVQPAVQGAFVAWQPLLVAVPRDLAPGRGLAGPPLPARGPPARLI